MKQWVFSFEDGNRKNRSSILQNDEAINHVPTIGCFMVVSDKRGIGVAEIQRRMGILRLIAVESIAARMSVEISFPYLNCLPQL